MSLNSHIESGMTLDGEHDAAIVKSAFDGNLKGAVEIIELALFV